MNVLRPSVFIKALGLGRELKLIMFVLMLIVCLPVFITLLLTQVGLSAVSTVLVSTQNGTAILHDPGSGAVAASLTGPVIWPVSGIVTLEFGAPDLPYQSSHTGIDIASPNHQSGDPVMAFAAGRVIYAGYDNLGFGNHVIIDHGNNITSLYGHLESYQVHVGEIVQAGTVVGLRGSTGWSTGPHLHFQIDVHGIPVDPRTFIPGNP